MTLTGDEQRVLDKYLSRYAEPEAAYAFEISSRYRAAIVVPLCAEAPECIEQLAKGLTGAKDAPSLVIAVVNARRDAPEQTFERNVALLEDWRGRSVQRRVFAAPTLDQRGGRAPAACELLELPGAQGRTTAVLLLDASSPGHRFPAKQGVGLARRIGCDVAAAMVRSGHLASRYIGSADGDVHLPEGYVTPLAKPPRAAALLFPFQHRSLGDEQTLAATELVELSFRYYLLGLAWAGSPYAYHALGSCLAPEVVAYARARGYPRREAAEDFHLLAKLAKLGRIETLTGPGVCIEARRSDRVPFGTGPAVEHALRVGSSVFTLHDPRVFRALKALLGALRGMALAGEVESAETNTARAADRGTALGGDLPAGVRDVLRAQVDCWVETLRGPLASCPSAAHRLHRTFEAFDALATLRAVHSFRDAGLAPVPWRQALAEAPFLHAAAGCSALDALRAAREAEAQLPALRGLASPRTATAG